MPTWLLIRLITIPLGILSALALARDGLGFKLFPFLDAIITSYGILLDDLFLDIALAIFEPVFQLLKTWFDWNWSLFSHWKHGFMLCWLYFTAFPRHALLKDGALRRWREFSFVDWVVLFISWGLAMALALVTGALTGTVGLDHPNIFIWPFAGYWLVLAANDTLFAILSYANQAPALGAYFRNAVVEFVAAAVCTMLALGHFSSEDFREIPFVGSSLSPGLTLLAGFIATSATLLVVDGLYADNSTQQSWAFHPNVRIGLDVLSVLGGAAIITYLAHLMA